MFKRNQNESLKEVKEVMLKMQFLLLKMLYLLFLLIDGAPKGQGMVVPPHEDAKDAILDELLEGEVLVGKACLSESSESWNKAVQTFFLAGFSSGVVVGESEIIGSLFLVLVQERESLLHVGSALFESVVPGILRAPSLRCLGSAPISSYVAPGTLYFSN